MESVIITLIEKEVISTLIIILGVTNSYQKSI